MKKLLSVFFAAIMLLSVSCNKQGPKDDPKGKELVGTVWTTTVYPKELGSFIDALEGKLDQSLDKTDEFKVNSKIEFYSEKYCRFTISKYIVDYPLQYKYEAPNITILPDEDWKAEPWTGVINGDEMTIDDGDQILVYKKQ